MRVLSRYGGNLLLVALCAVAYGPFLHGPFLYDDVPIIAENPHLANPAEIGKFFSVRYWNEQHLGTRGVFRPLRETVFTLLRAAFGPEPIVFHMVSFSAHVAATLMVYALGVRALRDRTAALVGAALFAVHPVHLEAVLWAKNLGELMAALFVLGSALLLLRAFRSEAFGAKAAWGGGATALYAGALLCKESGLALPLALAAYVIISPQRRRERRGTTGEGDTETHRGCLIRGIATLAPMLLLAAGYVAMQFAASQLVGAAEGMRDAAPDEALWLRPALVGKTYAWYGLLLLFPAGLSAQYHFAFPISYTGGESLPFLAVFAGLAAAAFAACVRRPRLAWLALWPFLFLVPASNLIPFRGRPVGDQRLYVPSIGFCLILGAAASGLMRRAEKTAVGRRPVAGLTIAALGLMLLLAFHRGPVWTDAERFWRDMARTSPLQAQANLSLAEQYWRRGPRWASEFRNRGFALATLCHADYALQGEMLDRAPALRLKAAALDVLGDPEGAREALDAAGP